MRTDSAYPFIYLLSVKRVYKAHKCIFSRFVALVHTRVEKHLTEDLAYLLLDNMLCIVGTEFGMTSKHFLCPVGMLYKLGIGVKLFAVHQSLFKRYKLLRKSCGQYSKSHYLDKPDILLLDVMERGIGMI